MWRGALKTFQAILLLLLIKVTLLTVMITLNFMVLVVVFLQVFCEQAKEKHSSGESLQWYVDVMVGQMTHAHETREQDLQSKIHELKVTVKDITQKNENLSSAYRYVEFHKANLVHNYSNAKAREQ